ncbi:MAG: Rrf2 family transcriptional regulator [Roseiarcus sp.]
MGTSTRFAVGVHLLTALAANPGRILRSEDVAESANTNPVVVRRLFSLMTTAGLIRARLGPGGGFELARPASDINLRDVFTAVESGELFTEHRSPPSATCQVGAHILPVLREATAPAVEALEEELSRTTIADIAEAVLARSNGPQIGEAPSSRRRVHGRVTLRN